MNDKRAKDIEGVVSAVMVFGFTGKDETLAQATVRYGEDNITLAEAEEIVEIMKHRTVVEKIEKKTEKPVVKTEDKQAA